MKYIVLIHANPQPWGHPVEDHLSEYRDQPQEAREKRAAYFDAFLGELQEAGELIGGEALGNPEDTITYRWGEESATQSDGPYAETKEHLAGFFIIDVVDPQRAAEVGAGFAGPGETIELRPAWDGTDKA